MTEKLRESRTCARSHATEFMRREGGGTCRRVRACKVQEWHSPLFVDHNEQSQQQCSTREPRGAPRPREKNTMGRVHLQTKEAGQLSFRGVPLGEKRSRGRLKLEGARQLSRRFGLGNEPRACARSCCKGGRRLTPLVR